MTGDRGSAGLLGLLGAVSAVGAAAVAGAVVSATLTHTRADSVADMVALGAAATLLTDPDPCRGADELAAVNDADLISCRVDGLVVAIEVAERVPPLLRIVTPSVTGSARAELRTDLAVGPLG